MCKGSEHSGNCSTLVPLEFRGHRDAREGGGGQTVKGHGSVQRPNQELLVRQEGAGARLEAESLVRAGSKSPGQRDRGKLADLSGI